MDNHDPFAHLPAAQPTLLDLPKKDAKGRPVSSEPRPQTISEAKLLAMIWKEPRGGEFYRQKLLWMQRYRDSETYSKEQIQERRLRLYQDSQTLKALLARPAEELEAEGWDAAKWWAMFQRLRGWMGHLEGLDSACMSRR
jgi:hypothetical protein